MHKFVLSSELTQKELLTIAHKIRTHVGTQQTVDSIEDTWWQKVPPLLKLLDMALGKSPQEVQT